MTSPQSVQLSIPANSEFIAVARLSVSGVAARMDFSIEDIEDIKVAVSEACTNVIQHAYANTQSGVINITFTIHKDLLEITVKDSGKGFNPNNVESEKTKGGNSDLYGLGLGLVFIQSLMDDAQINSEQGIGTTLTMVKKRPQHVA